MAGDVTIYADKFTSISGPKALSADETPPRVSLLVPGARPNRRQAGVTDLSADTMFDPQHRRDGPPDVSRKGGRGSGPSPPCAPEGAPRGSVRCPPDSDGRRHGRFRSVATKIVALVAVAGAVTTMVVGVAAGLRRFGDRSGRGSSRIVRTGAA